MKSKNGIRWHPLPADRRTFLEDRNKGYMADPRGRGLSRLKEKLLNIAGEEVCLQFEEDLAKLLKRGRSFPAGGAWMRIGQRCRCHANSVLLWKKNPHLRIVVGWALSSDGIWRQHTFCWYPERQRVIETTTKRVAYFGFILTKRESEDFFENQL